MFRLTKFRINNWVYFMFVCSLGSVVYMTCNSIDDYRLSNDSVIIHWHAVDNDISCHNSTLDDGLPSAEDPKFSPGPKSIFFHETSCRGGIDSRQACSIESAARAHPDWEVYVLFNSPVSENMLKVSCIANLLRAFPNLKVARIHAKEYSKDTTVHSVVTTKLGKSFHPIEDTSNIMRIITLNKYGGVYLDLDQLVINSLNSLPENWIVKEYVETVGTGIMAFSKKGVGHDITSAILKEIADSYDPQDWTTNGPEAIYRVLYRICPLAVENYGYCYGISIFGHELFYPIHITNANFLYQDNSDKSKVSTTVFTYHMWNTLNRRNPISWTSPYGILAQRYCPIIFQMYDNKFGI